MNGNPSDLIMTILILMAFAYLSRELEIMRAISEVENYLVAFKRSRDRAFEILVKQFQNYADSKEEQVLKAKLQKLIEITYILPVDLDPFGIVKKIKHIVKTAEREIERDVSSIAKNASKPDIQNLINLVEAVRALNFLYKIINHYYLIARKFKSLWLILQLNALLPFISEEFKALEGALEAFKNGIPIGDTAGPLVVAKLLRKYKGVRHYEPVKDTEIDETVINERRVFLVKAKGPGGTVGHLDEALRWILEREKISFIISIDAALKLEGEETGIISHGFGVAMGGIGVERFEIEELATRYNIPLYAVLIKMSEAEASSVMNEKIFKAVEETVQIIEEVINERTLPSSNIVILGVGNTIGVP